MRLVHVATMLLCLAGCAGAQAIMTDEGTMTEMTDATSDLRPILPPVIYAIPGVEANVYFDNIILSPHSDHLLWDVDCALGAHQQERWTAVPSAEQVGEHPRKLRVVSHEMQTVLQMETTLHVRDPLAGAGREITLLCIGASGTAASHYTARLVELFAADPAVDARLIGEAGPEDDPRNRHEGYGGWSCRTFVENWADGQDYVEIDGRLRRGRSPFLFEIDGEPRLDSRAISTATTVASRPISSPSCSAAMTTSPRPRPTWRRALIRCSATSTASSRPYVSRRRRRRSVWCR